MNPFVLGSIISTVGGALSASAQARAAAQNSQVDLGKLRRQAEKHGFNPLTVLGATGGQGFNNTSVPGFLSLAAGLVGPAMQDAFEMKRQLHNDNIANALLAAQTRQLSVRPSTAPVAASIDGPIVPFDEMGFVKVFTPAGLPVEIHKGYADRLGLTAGMVMLAEDYEAIYGDVGSAPMQLGMAGDGLWTNFKQWVVGNDENAQFKSGHGSSNVVHEMPSLDTRSWWQRTMRPIN